MNTRVRRPTSRKKQDYDDICHVNSVKVQKTPIAKSTITEKILKSSKSGSDLFQQKTTPGSNKFVNCPVKKSAPFNLRNYRRSLMEKYCVTAVKNVSIFVDHDGETIANFSQEVKSGSTSHNKSKPQVAPKDTVKRGVAKTASAETDKQKGIKVKRDQNYLTKKFQTDKRTASKAPLFCSVKSSCKSGDKTKGGDVNSISVGKKLKKDPDTNEELQKCQSKNILQKSKKSTKGSNSETRPKHQSRFEPESSHGPVLELVLPKLEPFTYEYPSSAGATPQKNTRRKSLQNEPNIGAHNKDKMFKMSESTRRTNGNIKPKASLCKKVKRVKTYKNVSSGCKSLDTKPKKVAHDKHKSVKISESDHVEVKQEPEILSSAPIESVRLKPEKKAVASNRLSKLRSKHSRASQSPSQASVGQQLKMKYLKVQLKPLPGPAKVRLRGKILPTDKKRKKSSKVRFKKDPQHVNFSRHTRSNSVSDVKTVEIGSSPTKCSSNISSPISPMNCSVALRPIKQEDGTYQTPSVVNSGKTVHGKTGGKSKKVPCDISKKADKFKEICDNQNASNTLEPVDPVNCSAMLSQGELKTDIGFNKYVPSENVLTPRLSDRRKLERRLIRRGLAGDSPELPFLEDMDFKQEPPSPILSSGKNKKVPGKVKRKSRAEVSLSGNSESKLSRNLSNQEGYLFEGLASGNKLNKPKAKKKSLKRGAGSINATSPTENESVVPYKKGHFEIKEEPISPLPNVLDFVEVKKEPGTFEENSIDFNSCSMDWSLPNRTDMNFSPFVAPVKTRDLSVLPKKVRPRKILGEREIQMVCTGMQTDDVVIVSVKSEPFIPEYEKYLGTSHLFTTSCLHEEGAQLNPYSMPCGEFIDTHEDYRLQEYIGSVAEHITSENTVDLNDNSQKSSPNGSDKENMSVMGLMATEKSINTGASSGLISSTTPPPHVRRSVREKKLSGWFKQILASKTSSAGGTTPTPTPTPTQTTQNNMPFIQDVVSLAAMDAMKNKAVTTPTPKPGAVTTATSTAAVVASQVGTPQRVITKTVKETTTQTKVMVQPMQPPTTKNKSVLCKPFIQTKATSCRPHAQSKEVQTEKEGEMAGKPILVPVPIPIYVPVPMAMYNIPVPYPVPLPIPIPVPCFIPTTKKSAAGIMKQITKIQSSMPADPFEAEMLAMAAAVAGEDKGSSSESDVEDSQDLPNDIMVPSQELLKPEPAEENTEDVLQMAFRMASSFPEAPLDMEDNVAAMPVNPGNVPLPQYSPLEPVMESPRRGRGKRRGGSSGGRHTRSSSNKKIKLDDNELSVPAPIEVLPQEPPPDENMVLKFTYGVNAWKHWVAQKNQQIEKTSTRSRRTKLYKSDVLACTADELNYSLCLFVNEVRKPNGEEYAPDSIYYLCLGLQEYLYENGRIDNIFTDLYYEQFNENLNQVIQRYEVRLNAQGLIVCRIEEEHLWESKQLGAHSPYVLLNTLIYFNTRFFMLRSPDEHLRLSFSHIMKHWKKSNLPAGKQGGRSVYLRYYAPQHQAEASQKRKRDDLPIYEQGENVDNPLRCPVKLYEFYLSKCPESIKNRNDVFYLTPERSCVPDSPVWYSTLSLGKDIMSRMLNRLQVVKEVQEAQLVYQPGMMM